MKTNIAVHFEIPVLDLDRAEKFYSIVFETELAREIVDGYEMAFFPSSNSQFGASGALAKGSVYKPSKEGVFVYFGVENIDAVLEKVVANGGSILYPKKENEGDGFVAEFEDSEGNRIAVYENCNF